MMLSPRRHLRAWRTVDWITVLIPVLFILTVVGTVFIAMIESYSGSNPPHGAVVGDVHTPAAPRVDVTNVPGFFQQDDPTTDDATFVYNETNLGLINRSYPTDDSFDPKREKTQWQRFEHYVDSLNKDAPENVQYKVLYMGRHGEGYHNVAEAFYGTKAWDDYWSKLDGNDTITWADAHLTEKGIGQALVANAFWKSHLATAGIPAPQSYYVSPLARCLATANYTFSGLDLPKDRPFAPVIKELLREALGEHTCDRRSNKTWIESTYPTWTFEPGFAEDDELWVADARETDPEIEARMKKLLTDVFTHDKNTWVSFSSHSGAIAAILRVIGHRKFSLLTGAVIPVLVKGESVG